MMADIRNLLTAMHIMMTLISVERYIYIDTKCTGTNTGVGFALLVGLTSTIGFFVIGLPGPSLPAFKGADFLSDLALEPAVDKPKTNADYKEESSR